MDTIKNEVKHFETQRQILLLTLAPQNSSSEFLTNYLAVSGHVVRQSREFDVESVKVRSFII